MSAIKLSSRYSRSLITLAKEQNVLEEVLQDIKAFKKIFKENRDLITVLRSPVITSDKKLRVFELAFKSKIQDITYRFIKLLIEKGREAYFPDIVESYIIKHNEMHGISPVKITTAIELDDDFENLLMESVKTDSTVGKIQLQKAVDPGIIGGFIIQYQDKLIDSSVSSRLKAISKNIEDSTYKVKF